jgi:hypothetical protein
MIGKNIPPMNSEAPATVIEAIPIAADEQRAARQHRIPLAAKVAAIVFLAILVPV